MCFKIGSGVGKLEQLSQLITISQPDIQALLA